MVGEWGRGVRVRGEVGEWEGVRRKRDIHVQNCQKLMTTMKTMMH